MHTPQWHWFTLEECTTQTICWRFWHVLEECLKCNTIFRISSSKPCFIGKILIFALSTVVTDLISVFLSNLVTILRFKCWHHFQFKSYGIKRCHRGWKMLLLCSTYHALLKTQCQTNFRVRVAWSQVKQKPTTSQILKFELSV